MASYSHRGDYSSGLYYEPSSSFPFCGSAASSIYDNEEGPGEEYPLLPYHDSYSSVQYQDSFPYGFNSTCYDHVENAVEDHSLVPYYSSYNSAYEWNDEFNQDQVSFYQPDDYSTYDVAPAAAAASWSRISYSALARSEPKCITLFGESPDHYSVQNRFLVSYNVSDFNEPEDIEYDPTPYGGGYDIAATYGKPLSPSEETCYPPSHTSPVLPIVVHPPAAKEEDPPAQVQPTDEEPVMEILPSVDNDSQREEDDEQPDDTDVNGNDSAYEHNEKQVVPYQVPSGYGLETVDICESLFGPWPCLTRNYRRAYDSLQDQEECRCGSNGNQWNDAADYLFGSSNPYGQTMQPGDGQVHAYHRQNYQEDPLHHAVNYVYQSWST